MPRSFYPRPQLRSVSAPRAVFEPLETRQLLSAALDHLHLHTDFGEGVAPAGAAIITESDAYETNDSREAATFLGAAGTLSSRDGLATATNNDWYRISAPAAGEVMVTLDAIAEQGELNVELYDANGNKLDGNYRVENTSTVGTRVSGATDVYVFVYGHGGYAGNAYNLTWTSTPSTVSPAGDAYEKNDLPEQARVFTAASGALSTTDGLATATDADWYRFNAAAGAFSVTLDSVVADGELNVELYDANGNKLDGNYRSENVSTVSTTLASAQEVRAFVYGSDGYPGSPYDLSWAGATALPTPGAGEDAYEENDTADQAFRLGTPAGSLLNLAGRATATDNDFYVVRAAAGAFTAQLQATAAEGELNIELYDTAGTKLAGNYQREDDSSVTTTLASVQDVLIYIYGSGSYRGDAYELRWNGAEPNVPTPLPPPTPDEPQITFLDAAGQAVDELTIANWQSSYASSNATTLLSEFIDPDPERFYVQAADAGSNVDPEQREVIYARLGTDSGDVDFDGDVTDHDDDFTPIALQETGANTGVFRSVSQILVADAADDRHLSAAVPHEDQRPDTGDVNGDRTHLVGLGGTVTARLEARLATSVSALVPVEATLNHLNYVLLRETAGGSLLTSPETLTHFVGLANEQFGQAGIALAFDPATDILIADPPAGVDLTDGTEIADGDGEMSLLTAAFATTDPSTMTVFYVDDLTGPLGGGYRGFAYWGGFNARSIYLNSNPFAQHFTLAHEILHVALESGHLDAPYDILTQSTSIFNGVESSKRIPLGDTATLLISPYVA